MAAECGDGGNILKEGGKVYYFGYDVPQDTAQALRWFEAAAERDIPKAKELLEKAVKSDYEGVRSKAEETLDWIKRNYA